MYNNILVVADQDREQHKAMSKAQAIAQADTRITVIGFVSDQHGDPESRDGELRTAIEAVFTDPTRVHYETVKTGDIPNFCKDYCERHDIDLLIKTGHRSESLFHTPLDWQLLREVQCPVMITSVHKWNAKPNLLVTIDLGNDKPAQVALNEKVANWAREWAEVHGSNLHVAYCIAMSAATVELDIKSSTEVLRKQGAEAKEKLTAFCEAQGLNYSQLHIDAGEPDRVLPSMADSIKADLVVIGSAGRKGATGMIIGNTAEQTMRKLRTDIAVIHPDK